MKGCEPWGSCCACQLVPPLLTEGNKPARKTERYKLRYNIKLNEKERGREREREGERNIVSEREIQERERESENTI